MKKEKPSIYTIAHSTRTIEEFVALLAAHGVRQVADVRTIPKSRHNPQFNSDALRASLAEAYIRYEHIAALGGLRRAKKDSMNLGWRNASFRGYADYMQTPEFEAGIERLEDIAAKQTTAIMCAEAVHWRCHRSLIADALTERGWRVFHIQSQKAASRHTLTSFLKMRGGKLTYPKEKG